MWKRRRRGIKPRRVYKSGIRPYKRRASGRGSRKTCSGPNITDCRQTLNRLLLARSANSDFLEVNSVKVNTATPSLPPRLSFFPMSRATKLILCLPIFFETSIAWKPRGLFLCHVHRSGTSMCIYSYCLEFSSPSGFVTIVLLFWWWWWWWRWWLWWWLMNECMHERMKIYI